MNCKYPKCNKPLPPAVPGGRRVREYCNNAHKQAHYRLTHQAQEDNQEEVTKLRCELEEARQQITELEQEVTRLLVKLDVERRFHEDHEKRGFKGWLKKQPAARTGEIERRILSDDFIPGMGSRALYEAHLRKNGYTPNEIERFRDLWKLMLLS